MGQEVFTMSEEDYEALLSSCRPVAYLVFGGTQPRSQQENANDAWKRLGDKMGFNYRTVSPHGSNPRSFTAERVAPKASQ